MPLTKRNLKKFMKQLYIRYKDDDISALSAQLSFYILLSMFPFLLFLLNILSFTPVSAAEFTINITKLMPADVAGFFSSTINEIAAAKSPALISFSALFTVFSASSGIKAISRGLNKAYDTEERRPFWKVGIISVVFTAGIAVMVLTTMLFLIFGNVIGEYLFSHLPDTQTFMELWKTLKYIVPIGMMAVVFTLLYICVPNSRITFKGALPGSLFAAAGWIIVSSIFSIYVNNFANYARVYGSIGGIILLLIWIYLSSMIILLGGEINATCSYFRLGSKIDKYENQSIKLPIWNILKNKKNKR